MLDSSEQMKKIYDKLYSWWQHIYEGEKQDDVEYHEYAVVCTCGAHYLACLIPDDNYMEKAVDLQNGKYDEKIKCFNCERPASKVMLISAHSGGIFNATLGGFDG